MYLTVADIPVEFVRRPVRALRLTVYTDGRVRLVVPTLLPESDALSFLREKTDWILTRRTAMLSRPRSPRLRYTDGEAHLLFGIPYPLRICHIASGAQAVLMRGAELCLYCRPNTTEARRCALMADFYRSRLHAYLTASLARYTAAYAEPPVTFRIRRMKTEWGSCRARTRALMFNLELARVPLPLVDYVVVHELSHLQVQNHGPAFQRLMDLRMPEWRTLRKQLNAFLSSPR